MSGGSRSKADDLLAQPGREGASSGPDQPARRPPGGFGPLLAVVLIGIAGAVALRAWYAGGESSGAIPPPSFGPTASALGSAPSTSPTGVYGLAVGVGVALATPR